jgi:transcriptional regulator with GAF, ATPase, and Fis domain
MDYIWESFACQCNRIFQEQHVERPGGEESIKVGVRVMAATMDISTAVKKKF